MVSKPPTPASITCRTVQVFGTSSFVVGKVGLSHQIHSLTSAYPRHKQIAARTIEARIRAKKQSLSTHAIWKGNYTTVCIFHVLLCNTLGTKTRIC